jgi:hypothetical protein
VTARFTSLPLRPVPRSWQRDMTSPARPCPDRLPEPTQFDSLTILRRYLHAANPGGTLCTNCGADWPCESVRLAARLRDGF